MTDKHESLSALMDGDVDLKALDRLLSSADEQESWTNYHLIGQAMRDELPARIDMTLADRISAAIAEEPTVLAPQAKPKTDSARQPAYGKVIPFLRHAGQYAIAATVAAFAVVGVQQYAVQQDSGTGDSSPVVQTIPLIGGAAPVSASLGTAKVLRIPADEQQSTQQRLVEQRMRINAYLQDHELQMRMQQQADQPGQQQDDVEYVEPDGAHQGE